MTDMRKHDPTLVTIGIPTRNRAASYLPEAIESALAQTYPAIEIIVSDNCSTDHTDALVASFSDPRLRYFRHARNIGANGNFNFCLEQARGDYFLLLHDDDRIDCDFVEACLQAAGNAASFGLIRTGTRVIDSHGQVLHELTNQVGGLPPAEFFRGWFAGKTSWYLCSTLFNTAALRNIGGFHSKRQLTQDGIAVARLAVSCGRADVPEVKASFRKHSAELTFGVPVGDWCDDFLALLDLMCSLIPESDAVLRAEGMRFLARLSYNRALAIRSPFRRWAAYAVVLRKFGFRHLPPPTRGLPRRAVRRGMRVLGWESGGRKSGTA